MKWSSRFFAIALICLFSVSSQAFFLPTLKDMIFPGAKPNEKPGSINSDFFSEFVEYDGKNTVDVLAVKQMKTNQPIVIYFYGNGQRLEVLEENLMVMMNLSQQNLVAFDYPGYGNSKGEPSENSLLKAGVAVVKWTLKQNPEAQIHLVGYSLGGAVALQVANEIFKSDDEQLKQSLKKIVLLSSFANMKQNANELLQKANSFVRKLVENKLDGLLETDFNSVGVIAHLKIPILIVHGDADKVVSLSQGQKLFEAANKETSQFLLYPGAEHYFWDSINSGFGQMVQIKIKEFLESP